MPTKLKEHRQQCRGTLNPKPNPNTCTTCSVPPPHMADKNRPSGLSARRHCTIMPCQTPQHNDAVRDQGRKGMRRLHADSTPVTTRSKHTRWARRGTLG